MGLPAHAHLTLMPELQARRALQSAGATLRLTVLRPVAPTLGCGTLRVLRVRPTKGESQLEVVAGYDSYERLER